MDIDIGNRVIKYIYNETFLPEEVGEELNMWLSPIQQRISNEIIFYDINTGIML